MTTERLIPGGFCYPEGDSVRGRVLASLLRGETLTQAEALDRWHTSRLGSAIFQLRGLGWPVATTLVDVLTADRGREARIARYWLPSFAIQQAGPRGQLFAASALKHEESK